MPEKINQVLAENQYIDDLVYYTIATNLVRALPDARDGLKPVARRIIYAIMNDEKAISEATIVKSASLSGSVMKYHPHSDSYGTFKTLINPFEIKVPILIGQGGWGSISGEGPAASRYTECYLSPFGLEAVVGALHENPEVVDWNPSYDNKRQEPQYLPVKVPLLLIEGIVGGIGTGIKADLPTHNMREIIDTTLRYMDNQNIDVVFIPDHCLPCDIINTNWKEISDKGFGTYRARAIMENSVDKDGYPIITIVSAPTYGTNDIVEKIETGITEGKFPQILDIVDASKNEYGVRIFIKLKKGTDVNFVKESLYKYTPCEQSFRINFQAVLGTELVRLSYKEYIDVFVKFACSNKIREYSAKHYVISTRLHKIEAFIKVVGSPDIDKIIELIKKRTTDTDNELIEMLIKKFHLTDVQASYIINAQLKQLSKGSYNRYIDEFNKLSEKEAWFEKRLANAKLIIEDVKADLIYIRDKYSTSRICRVVNMAETGNIPAGTFKFVITENNYVRKLLENDPVNIIKGDKPKYILTVSNLESVLLFGSSGRVFKLAVHKIPIVEKNDPGIDIKGVLKGLTSDIIAAIYEPRIKMWADQKNPKIFMAIATKFNTIKKLEIEDFLSASQSGLVYSKLAEGDEIIDVHPVVEKGMDFVIYNDTKALRIGVDKIPTYKRNSLGVVAMNTKTEIDGIGIIYKETTSIIVVTMSGMVNRFSASGLESTQRNKAGSKVIDLKKGDKIINIFGVIDTDILVIETTNGILKIAIKDIPMGSTISKGIKAISTKSDIIIKSYIEK